MLFFKLLSCRIPTCRFDRVLPFCRISRNISIHEDLKQQRHPHVIHAAWMRGFKKKLLKEDWV